MINKLFFYEKNVDKNGHFFLTCKLQRFYSTFKMHEWTIKNKIKNQLTSKNAVFLNSINKDFKKKS